MSLQIFGYAGCTTVKKAVKWAEENSLAPTYKHFNKVDGLEEALKTWAAKAGIEKVFNAKAQTFKKLDASEQEAITKSPETMIAAMAADPRFIKRPVGTNGDIVLTGFDVTQWETAFR